MITPTMGASRTYKHHNSSNSLLLLYGIQRKIGRIGYLDCSTGLGVYYVGPHPSGIGFLYKYFLEIPLKLGFGVAF